MKTLTLPNMLVDAEWLQQHIGHPQLVLLDASLHMSGSTRDACTEWRDQRIPSARFFDFNHTICDASSHLPHMLPSVEQFTADAQVLGINQDSVVVVYDSVGIFSSPRAWWMLTVMGCQQCAVLNGGLPAWITQGGTVDTAPTKPSSDSFSGNFIAQFQPQLVKNRADIRSAINSKHVAIMDARSKERFQGTAPESREGLISGHIPSSINLPFNTLLTNGMYRSPNELREIFLQHTGDKTVIYSTCGSGVTACIIALAAQLAGYTDTAVYDGSWCEWGQPDLQLPINTTES